MAVLEFPVDISLEPDRASIAEGVRFECRFLDKSLRLDADQVSLSNDRNGVAVSRPRNTKWARLNIWPGDRPHDSCVIGFKICLKTLPELGNQPPPRYRLVLSKSLDFGATLVALDKCMYTFSDDLVGQKIELSALFSVPPHRMENNEIYRVLLEVPERSKCVIYGLCANWVNATTTSNPEAGLVFANKSRIPNNIYDVNSCGIVWGTPSIDSTGDLTGWAIDLVGSPLEVSAVCGSVEQQAVSNYGDLAGVKFGRGFYRLQIASSHAQTGDGCIVHFKRSSGNTIFLSIPVLAPHGSPSDMENFICNGNFLQWPNGLRVNVDTRFHEFASGWVVDFRRDTAPTVSVTTAEIVNSGLKRGNFGARVAVSEVEKAGYVRILASLKGDFSDPGDYFFSCGFQIPFYEAHSNLFVSEIYLATVAPADAAFHVKKIKTIKKLSRINRSIQLKDIKFGLSLSMVSAINAAGKACVAFELSGEGELILFDAKVSIARSTQSLQQPAQGDFEDIHVAEQSKMLKLSPIWSAIQRIDNNHVERSAVSVAKESKIQIVIPVFNAPVYVEDCVKSIIENTDHPFEIILSDDGSNSYTLQRLNLIKERYNFVNVFYNERNIGYTRNINQALQRTLSRFVVLMNSDTLVTRGWLGKLLYGIGISEDTAAVGPVSNAASWQSVPKIKVGKDWATNTLPNDLSVEDMSKLVEELSVCAYPTFPILNGFCTMFRREALETVGFFSDGMFPYGYGEENDLCLRLGQNGYLLRIVDNCYVYHVKSKSFGSKLRSELSRNSNVLLRKRHPYINFEALEQEMRDCRALSILRENLTNRLRSEKYPRTFLEKAG